MNVDISSVLVFASVVLAVLGVASLLERKPDSILSIRRGGPSSGIGQAAGRLLFSGSAQSKDEARLFLLQAGYDAPDAVEAYRTVRACLTLISPALVLAMVPLINSGLSPSHMILFAATALFVGYFLPQLYVRSRRSRRQRAIREDLPDILDLLLVTTEAGLGLDTAVLRVGEETLPIHPTIANELLQVSAELRAGRPRAEAFRGFAERCGIPETTSMVNLLIQSDHLGTSMASALRAFSDDMRSHRLLKAEEVGQKIAVKLTMILATCFLPALLITIGAPIAVTIVAKFAR